MMAKQSLEKVRFSINATSMVKTAGERPKVASSSLPLGQGARVIQTRYDTLKKCNTCGELREELGATAPHLAPDIDTSPPPDRMHVHMYTLRRSCVLIGHLKHSIIGNLKHSIRCVLIGHLKHSIIGNLKHSIRCVLIGHLKHSIRAEREASRSTCGTNFEEVNRTQVFQLTTGRRAKEIQAKVRCLYEHFVWLCCATIQLCCPSRIAL